MMRSEPITTLTLTGTPISGLIPGIAALFRARSAARPPEDTPDAARNRRAFIAEMQARPSEAFASELDVQQMMHAFPGRF